MPTETFSSRMYSLQKRIVRRLDHAYMFLKQAHPLLEPALAKTENNRSRSNRRDRSLSVGKREFSKRADTRLKEIYSDYVSSGLFETFLVNAVAQFESFLAEVLITFLVYHPLRITETVQGIPGCPNISPRELDTDRLIKWVLVEHIANVFRQRPNVYMAYAVNVLNISDDPSFADYYEIAATRDLVIHNNSLSNALYRDKAGKKARVSFGETLPVDQKYYYAALSKLKKVSRAITREIEEKYREEKEEKC